MGRFLKQSGIEIGDILLPAHPSNPYGHFEDAEILDFHIQVLRREYHGEHQWVPKPPSLTESDREFAMSLAERRRNKRRPWGWKEPRACLFLDLWAKLIPEAKFLFVFRHPECVVDSLGRRHDFAATNRLENNKFLRTWIVYNSEILSFYQQYRDRCMLFALESAITRPDKFIHMLSTRANYNFREEDFVASYDPDILGKVPRHRRSANLFLRLKAWQVHRRLLSLTEV